MGNKLQQKILYFVRQLIIFSGIRVAFVLWAPSLSEPEAIRVQVPLMLAWALARIHSPGGARRQETTAFMKIFRPPLRFSSNLNLKHLKQIIFRISSPIFTILFYFGFIAYMTFKGNAVLWL